MASPTRPWRRAAPALVGLGVLFYASYGFANWWASTRPDVPSIVFGWEAHIPFLAWTILPYWSTNLLYAGSLFVCADERELSTHVRRLLTTQLLAIACFFVAPLKFIWPKPDTSGLFGFFFDSLGAFDKPFNQAPSLHVALTVVLGALYLPHLPRMLIAPFLAWSVLVILSTMTTFQHHFIDLPTGGLLGLLVVWAWPMEGASPLAGAQFTAAPDRRRLARNYLIGALAIFAAALALGNVFLWLLWPAVSLILVAAAYVALGPAAFGKNAEGKMALPARLLLAPYLAGAFINSRLWARGEPRCVEIANNVFLGRFPASRDLDRFAAVIDLTAELPRPAGAVAWRAFPCLDLAAPDPDVLSHAADAITDARAHGPALVCCALGYGRSAAALAVWLARSGQAAGPAAAIERLRRLRPRLALSAAQIRAVETATNGG
jgi:protein-tyrosine phosphatase